MHQRTSTLQLKATKCNLSRSEDKTLNRLRKNKNLTIKSVDKGSCIAIEDTEEYVQNGREHLNDKKIYKEIPLDYTPSLARAINHLTQQMKHKKHIDNINTGIPKVRQGSKDTTPILPQKNTQNTDGGPTEKLSNLADYIFKKN